MQRGIAAEQVEDAPSSGKPISAANVAPEVQIVSPRPSQLLTAVVAPTFTVRWEGTDTDAKTGRPLQYRYIVFSDRDEYLMFLVEPDSLRRRDAPGFEGWTRVHGNHSEIELSGLIPNSEYLIAVVAIDEQGEYSRTFSLSRNMLRLSVVPAGTNGPRLDVSGDIRYRMDAGGIQDDPATAPRFEIPLNRAWTLQWQGRAAFGQSVDGYRWALDPTKVESPSAGNGRAGGWSAWSLDGSTATVGPFASQGEHRLYIEARTATGLFTRLLIVLDAVAPSPVLDLARD